MVCMDAKNKAQFRNVSKNYTSWKLSFELLLLLHVAFEPGHKPSSSFAVGTQIAFHNKQNEHHNLVFVLCFFSALRLLHPIILLIQNTHVFACRDNTHMHSQSMACHAQCKWVSYSLPQAMHVYIAPYAVGFGHTPYLQHAISIFFFSLFDWAKSGLSAQCMLLVDSRNNNKTTSISSLPKITSEYSKCF